VVKTQPKRTGRPASGTERSEGKGACDLEADRPAGGHSEGHESHPPTRQGARAMSQSNISDARLVDEYFCPFRDRIVCQMRVTIDCMGGRQPRLLRLRLSSEPSTRSGCGFPLRCQRASARCQWIVPLVCQRPDRRGRRPESCCRARCGWPGRRGNADRESHPPRSARRVQLLSVMSRGRDGEPPHVLVCCSIRRCADRTSVGGLGR
jgi:hypothetical protein